MAGQIFSVNLKKIQCENFQWIQYKSVRTEIVFISSIFFIGNAETEKLRHITGQCIHANSNLVVY